MGKSGNVYRFRPIMADKQTSYIHYSWMKNFRRKTVFVNVICLSITEYFKLKSIKKESGTQGIKRPLFKLRVMVAERHASTSCVSCLILSTMYAGMSFAVRFLKCKLTEHTSAFSGALSIIKVNK